MLPQHWMVVINSLFLFFLTFFLIVYRYIYPKKILSCFTLLFLLSVLPTISVWRPGVYESGDFNLHIYEAMNFFDSLTQRVLIPKWGGELNATYGYPVFLFAYPLPNYLISLIHGFGFSFVASLKLFLSAAFVASGTSIYMYVKSILGKKSAVVSAIFYLFAPFHLIDLHYRVDVGEVLAYAILPLPFVFIERLLKKESILSYFFLSLSIGILILSHQAISLVGVFLILFYCIFRVFTLKRKKLFFFGNFAIILGVFLASFYWLPVLYEKQYTVEGLRRSSVYFQSWWEFLFSPWKYGFLFQGPKGQLSFLVGYAQLFVVILSIVFLWKEKIKKQNRNLLFFYLFFFLLFMFLLQSFSKPLWDFAFILNNFQFSYRLLILVNFCTAVIAGIVAITVKKKQFVILLCIFTILTTILNWGNRRTIPEITDVTLKKNVSQSTIQGEANGQSLSKWAPRPIGQVPRKHLEIVYGKGSIAYGNRLNNSHSYRVVAQTPLLLRENTLYFPNWVVYANKKRVSIDFNRKEFPGIIFFQLPKGTFSIQVQFENLLIQKISYYLSLVSFLLLLFMCFLIHFSKGDSRRS